MSEGAGENRRRATRLLVAFGAAVGVGVWFVLGLLIGVVAGPVIGGATGLVLAAGAGTGAAWRARQRAVPVILGGTGAVEVDAGAEPGYHNVVEGLCVAAGLPKPALFVVDDPALNLCVAGLDHRGAAVIATSGLLRALTRIELEGVLAHALTRVKTLEIAPDTLAVTTAGLPVLLAAGGTGMASALAPRSARLLGRVVGGRAELADDMEGLMLTRYPPGLIAALEKIAAQGSTLRRSSPALDHLWLAPSVGPSSAAAARLAELVDAHSAIGDRIEALREL